MRKKWIMIILIPILSITTLAILAILTIKKWNKEKEEMISRCYTYDREVNRYGTDIIDCYGYITINLNDSHEKIKYSIRDQRFSPWDLMAKINYLDQFKVINNKLYTITQEKLYWFDKEKNKYGFDFVQNGALKNFYVDSKNQIPRYLVFDTQTGNTDFYVSFNEMPEDTRKIFEELKQYDQYNE